MSADARAGAIAIALVDGSVVTSVASTAAAVAPGAWHRMGLRVDAETSRVEVEWDGAPAVAGTLPARAGGVFGRVGLVAGGEGRACFDDWIVRALARQSPAAQ